MSQQLVKKGTNGKHENVMPKSWIEAIKDKNTGQTLVEILQGFNMYFLSYNGNTSATRNMIPSTLRRKGLWISYVKYDGNVYTEWYAANEIDDNSWGDSSNWRIGNNTLVGDITISSNGNWVINGTETKFKAVGEKGNTPLLRVVNNKLQVSYDFGETYMDINNSPIYTKFRWLATTGDTQANNVGRIQASTDEGKTWTNMSNDFTNNLHIKKYIGVNESLPTSGIAEGTIYAKGPYYAEDDTLNDNPIYRLWVYAWKGNTLAWQDNGEFQSIAAGIVQETGESETEVMSQKAVTEKLSELVHPLNLFDWGRVNALGFSSYDSNYIVNEMGHIVKSGTLLLDIPITHLRGKKIYFGLHSKSDYIEYGQFYNGSVPISEYPGNYKIIGEDGNGLNYITLTHPDCDYIVPSEATTIRIQLRDNVELAEVYAGEVPYKGEALYDKDLRLPYTYKYLGGTESAVPESKSTYSTLKGISYLNENEELVISANGEMSVDYAFNFNSLLDELRGKDVYMNFKIENTSLEAVSVELYAYNAKDGVFSIISSSIFSIVSDEYTTPFNVPEETNHIRLVLRRPNVDGFIIKSLSFSENKHYYTDVRIYDNPNKILPTVDEYINDAFKKADLLIEKDTLYDGMKDNVKKVLVGSKIYRKVREGNVIDIEKEINQHDFYYTSMKKLPRKIENVMVVDTKGTILDSYNRGRVLELITSDGWMYFRNAYNRFEKIKVEDFLSNLIPHDGSGIEADKIEWLDLPSTQTELEKAEKLSKELATWKMYDDSKSSAFTVVYNKSDVGWISREMANGNIVNQQRTIKKEGAVITPRLNKPIIGNPTHLIIKENGNILYEKPLRDAISSDIKWGEMNANQGSVVYNNNVFAAINWNNGKQITVNGLNLVSGHTYEFILRGRRYGTNCTDGRVDLINSDVFGSIILEDTILMAANNSATLVDNSTTIAINKNMSEITLRAVAPEYIDFIYGNGASTTPNWGFCASENNLLLTEYVAEKRSGLAYLSKDNGESYDVIFDVSLNELFCNIGGGHIHGGCVDAYWNKIVLVLGDLDFAKGVYHADFNDSTTQDNISWVKEIPENPFYGRDNGEQYCSAFACEDFILFGTDTTPTGIFRMPRINKDKFTRREPSKLICGYVLSHVPSMFYRRNEQSPIFIASMVGGAVHPDREYNTSIYHCTWDGINVEEIYKDNVKCGGFGNNAYMVIFHYNGKVFMTQHGDNRFANNHTLFIGDYKV